MIFLLRFPETDFWVITSLGTQVAADESIDGLLAAAVDGAAVGDAAQRH